MNTHGNKLSIHKTYFFFKFTFSELFKADWNGMCAWSTIDCVACENGLHLVASTAAVGHFSFLKTSGSFLLFSEADAGSFRIH